MFSKGLRTIVLMTALGGVAPIASGDTVHDKQGFVTIDQEGRLWVFRELSPSLQEFRRFGELAKHVTRPGIGPGGVTLKAPDTETILSFLTTLPGFESAVIGDRVWVFHPGSPALSEFLGTLSLERRAERPGAGPAGLTVVAPDEVTLNTWLETLRNQQASRREP